MWKSGMLFAGFPSAVERVENSLGLLEFSTLSTARHFHRPACPEVLSWAGYADSRTLLRLAPCYEKPLRLSPPPGDSRASARYQRGRPRLPHRRLYRAQVAAPSSGSGFERLAGTFSRSSLLPPQDHRKTRPAGRSVAPPAPHLRGQSSAAQPRRLIPTL